MFRLPFDRDLSTLCTYIYVFDLIMQVSALFSSNVIVMAVFILLDLTSGSWEL